MSNRYFSKLIIFLLCVFLSSCATLSNSANYYHQAIYQVKKDNHYAAFMRLRALLNDNPHSPYAPKAAFAVGEYYFENNDYLDAAVAFREYIRNYPNDPGTVFAELVIYKMANRANPNKNIQLKEQYLLESIRKKMFSKPIFFIFVENRKSFSYRSIFGNIYSAFDYVDKVKVIRNDKLFLELSP